MWGGGGGLDPLENQLHPIHSEPYLSLLVVLWCRGHGKAVPKKERGVQALEDGGDGMCRASEPPCVPQSVLKFLGHLFAQEKDMPCFP